MRGVIIAGGSMENYEFHKALLRPDDFIICADGGLYHAAQMGLVPDLVIGDFDSFTDKVPPCGEVIRLNTHKDHTDTQACVLEAMERGYREFLILGAIGTRLDHTYANVCLLQAVLERGGRAELVNNYNRILLLDKDTRLTGTVGQTVSFLPFTDKVTGVRLQGFAYPLERATLERALCIGVSNVFVEKEAFVGLESGLLLCIFANDEGGR